MFRYHVELVGCEWTNDQPPEGAPVACFEVYCHRHGARYRVTHFPFEFTVRSAPETDTLFLLLLRGDTVLASGDAVHIGGTNRCVGLRTVALKAGGAVLCKVRIMWCVEAEDRTVFLRGVENCAGSEGRATPDAERDRPSIHVGGASVASGTLVRRTCPTEKPSTVLEVSPVCCEGSAPSGTAQHQEEGAATWLSNVSPPSPPAPPEKGAQWSVGSPQHALKDLLDYYVTSTQVVERPRAWRNLYTSPAPLLVASGLLQDEAESIPMKKSETQCAPRASLSVVGSSALEDIRLHPTKAPQDADDLHQTLYRQKMKVKWRTVVSPALAALPSAMHEGS
ncbi:hypothetical protein TraAM80_04898 [Trypanosoma rangeli]|uniref:Uncharacterized protein n=1 Tax=Trypanosoma rangeli TaxID=5698 RepID=A0A422NH47_TRYRA|nr:uncharacterized protein TraAM80_04898 [Trypanosoma rangeli]RNF04774.1 hypothetical protein TraAM80_04898 [Trypanosoma rangeli]|eukprot:RNF04774.1 hypothetical protein TraAM80_04898 [Trypanosoma rangeli]